MSEIKLEVGKTYVTRDGHNRYLIVAIRADTSRPFVGVSVGDGVRECKDYFTGDGFLYPSKEPSAIDLVAEELTPSSRDEITVFNPEDDRTPIAALGGKLIALGRAMQNDKTTLAELAGLAFDCGLSVEFRLAKEENA